MHRIRGIVITTALALAVAVPLVAQRPAAAVYDEARAVKLEGAVTRIDWVNPRAFVFIDVKDAIGVVNWAVEIGNPLDLEANGWKRSTLQIGDVIGVDAQPAHGVARQALAKSVVMAKTGKRLFTAAARRAATGTPGAAAPRWPGGHVRLGAAPGRSGYWSRPSTTVMIENGAKVAMSGDGLLTNLSDADRVAPFQPWAKAIYQYRQRTLLRDDPAGRCLPPGGPRQFQTPNGVQFVEQPDLGRVLVMLGGGDRNWHVIFTDGRPAGQASEVVPGYYGTSVGRWDGDTFVVDTVGFNERFWMAPGGLPHTEALHLTERFTRPDLNTLKYDVTVDDPRTYTRPWSSGWTLQWVADKDIQEYFCEENAESTFTR